MIAYFSWRVGGAVDFARAEQKFWTEIYITGPVSAFSFQFKYLLMYSQEADWTPFQTRCYSEDMVTPGIEPRTSGLAARNSDH
jgi:hypothetical protein